MSHAGIASGLALMQLEGMSWVVLSYKHYIYQTWKSIEYKGYFDRAITRGVFKKYADRCCHFYIGWAIALELQHIILLTFYVSWSTSELRVRLAPLNRFKPSSKIFYWPFQGGTSFVDLLCFCSVLCLLCFVRVCLFVLCGHLLGKGWPLGSRLWCLLWVCHFPIGILGQVWYLIVSIPDLCTLTYFSKIYI